MAVHGKRRLSIIGCGDIGLRAARLLHDFYRIYALTRNPLGHKVFRNEGLIPVPGDLDQLASLNRISSLGQDILHFAPPPPEGDHDPRTRHLLAALGKRQILPRCLIYISTSGVYGDCHGEWVRETRKPNPVNARAKRRLDAERQLRRWGARTGVRVCILRVPGIYAADRLPLERVRKGVPTLVPEEDSYTNHIHADDLARIAFAALGKGKPQRIYHAVDDSRTKMGDWFELLAERYNLPKPQRISRAEAQHVLTPGMLSFLNESRRLDNERIKKELGVKLRYPTVEIGVKEPLKNRNES